MNELITYLSLLPSYLGRTIRYCVMLYEHLLETFVPKLVSNNLLGLLDYQTVSFRQPIMLFFGGYFRFTRYVKRLFEHCSTMNPSQ